MRVGIDVDDFKRRMDLKYAIAQQEADAGTMNAQTNRMGVPIERTKADAQMLNARTDASVAPSIIQNNLAGAALNNANAKYVPYNSETDRIGAMAQQQNAQTQASIAPSIIAGNFAGAKRDTAEAGVVQQDANSRATQASAAMVGARAAADVVGSTNLKNRAEAAYDTAMTAQVAPNAASEREVNRSIAGVNDSTAAVNNFRPTAEQVYFGSGVTLGIPTAPSVRALSGNDATYIEPRLYTRKQAADNFSMGMPLTSITQSRMGLAMGTAKVPGQGSGKVDTVPAVLAPGEAVLNKAAAEAMGRGLIAALNAAGARKMGML